jgi:hypothetical protein
MSSKVSSFIMQIFRIIGSKTSISQMNKQGKVQNGYMFKYPSTKQNPAKHNFGKNDQKIIDKMRSK